MEGTANTAEAANTAPASVIADLLQGVCAGLIGHEHLVESLMIGLLTGGHLLIEGPPGLAKTRAVKRLASGLAGSFARVQCTPDLMPADMTGTQVFHPDTGEFEFIEGPVFHSLVLVDEINRAPPKVQSALLEAMAESQVTVAGITHALPPLFMVVATQNSIEHEGTFPLPEAQLDRFLMHVLVRLPDADAELAILDLVQGENEAPAAAAPAQVSASDILRARKACQNVHLSPALKDFMVRLVMATREGGPDPELCKAIEHPVSPRGTLAMAASVQARAMLRGRDYGLPEDVIALAPDILAHRIVPTWRAVAEGQTARSLTARLLRAVQPL